MFYFTAATVVLEVAVAEPMDFPKALVATVDLVAVAVVALQLAAMVVMQLF
jgi:hypothetical protein